MKLLSVLSLSLVLSCTTLSAQKVYEISAFGLKANSSKNASPVLQKALAKIKAEYKEGEKVILRFPEGRYEFHEKGAAVREYYISNHDQTNPKKVGHEESDIRRARFRICISRQDVACFLVAFRKLSVKELQHRFREPPYCPGEDRRKRSAGWNCF